MSAIGYRPSANRPIGHRDIGLVGLTSNGGRTYSASHPFFPGDVPMTRARLAVALAALVAGLALPHAQTDTSLSFFITSAGRGRGADLGGLAGADQHCQTLAAAVG